MSYDQGFAAGSGRSEESRAEADFGPTPDKPSAIFNALDELTDHVSRVQVRLNNLEKHLEPVLTPEQNVEETPTALLAEKSSINESKISRDLRRLLYQVADMRKQIDNIEERLEL